MAEYIKVEKPFLDKLRRFGLQVINQGLGVPEKPAKSLAIRRTLFFIDIYALYFCPQNVYVESERI